MARPFWDPWHVNGRAPLRSSCSSRWYVGSPVTPSSRGHAVTMAWSSFRRATTAESASTGTKTCSGHRAAAAVGLGDRAIGPGDDLDVVGVGEPGRPRDVVRAEQLAVPDERVRILVFPLEAGEWGC